MFFKYKVIKGTGYLSVPPKEAIQNGCNRYSELIKLTEDEEGRWR
jgi:hypothetical protein